jgi:histidinol phosphatase-like enzyme (inositol monophosphatase family)
MLDELAKFAAALTDLTRPVIHQYFRQNPDIIKKQDNSPVTMADQQVEQILRAAIRHRYPDHSIIGEEQSNHIGDAPYTWVIDPIDGTRSFSCGNPLFGTLIGILEHGQPQIGVIDLPMLENRWLGQMGKSCYCNTSLCHTSPVRDLASARIATTSSTLLGDEGRPKFERLAAACRVINYGGDCANYAYLASGWCDLVVEANLQAYDIMAAVAVVTAAGGVVSRWDGTPIHLDDFDGSIIAAASPKLHAAAVSYLSN